MIVIKSKAALDKMRVAGQLLATIVQEAGEKVESNITTRSVTTLEIDRFIEESMKKVGLYPVCKGYGGYKHATCISLNDVVIHGVPSDKVVLKSGDFVKIDVAGSYKGYCADMTRYFFVGGKPASEIALKLARVAQSALDAAIFEIAPGKHLSDISSCIQQEVERAGFGVVRNFAGHGIGKKLHEDPEIPNFGKSGQGPILREGMTFAIEPMITQGDYAVRVAPDGWSIKTVDGGLSAHVEDTVVVVKDGAEVLTRKNI